MWKYLNESVAGTSHLANGMPCQDHSCVSSHGAGKDEVLIIACSDGAGSAAQAQVGSELACKTLVTQVSAFLGEAQSVAEITNETVNGWFRAVHERIKLEAERTQVGLREFSCTLLLGVIGRAKAVFAQIGDGAIVIAEGTQYRPVFWPDSGEYHNTTYFVTDPKFPEHLKIDFSTGRLDEVGFLSDGLQMLALDYATKKGHSGFFAPLFRQLREHQKEELMAPLRQFLDSKPVNDRTDDDKTLILVQRSRP